MSRGGWVRGWLVPGMGAAPLALVAAACAGQGLSDDGTTVSFGPPSAGALLAPVALADHGEGYYVPTTWSRRGLRYGTDELVAMVGQVAAALHREQPDRLLAVADLSLPGGGPSAWHHSHQTGRDVDFIYFARDAAGRPVATDVMRRYGADGARIAGPAGAGAGDPLVFFDDRANWRLVRALMESPVADVQWIFVSDDLRQRLLDWAAASGEPPPVVEEAAALMHQPTGAEPHDDHMHVRVYCAPTDVRLGCVEIGPYRWHKKDYKYRPTAAAPAAPAGAGSGEIMAALPVLPLRGFVPR